MLKQLQQILAVFPDEVRLSQYPCYGTRIPESALEIQVLLHQCQFKFEKQDILDTQTIGLIQKRVIEIEDEVDGAISRVPGGEKRNEDHHYRYDILKGFGLLFPLDYWKSFYSKVESLTLTVSIN
jgi:hypothetical protein